MVNDIYGKDFYRYEAEDVRSVGSEGDVSTELSGCVECENNSEV